VTYSSEDLVLHPRIAPGELGLVNRVTPEEAGWKDLRVEVRRLGRGQRWTLATGECESVAVLLGGMATARSNRIPGGAWQRIGRRPDVFSGMPWAMYLPWHTEVEIECESEQLELACAMAPTDQDHEPRLVRPADVAIELRGGGANSRQINQIVPPGFDCDRLVSVEVYTPSGNWSSYPPHKHDEHRVAPDGQLVEADLEEVYLYKMNRPGGHALQRIYSEDGSVDAAVIARDGDIVLVPYGYHPVSAAYGYDCYYLNFLAGSAQSLACTDDPAHAWVKETWPAPDPRLPMVSRAMDEEAR
jgi:5-deoxy-glucuronate isomerase